MDACALLQGQASGAAGPAWQMAGPNPPSPLRGPRVHAQEEQHHGTPLKEDKLAFCVC